MPLKPRKAGDSRAHLAKLIGQRLGLRRVLGTFALDLFASNPCCSFRGRGSLEQRRPLRFQCGYSGVSISKRRFRHLHPSFQLEEFVLGNLLSYGERRRRGHDSRHKSLLVGGARKCCRGSGRWCDQGDARSVCTLDGLAPCLCRRAAPDLESIKKPLISGLTVDAPRATCNSGDEFSEKGWVVGWCERMSSFGNGNHPAHLIVAELDSGTCHSASEKVEGKLSQSCRRSNVTHRPSVRGTEVCPSPRSLHPAATRVCGRASRAVDQIFFHEFWRKALLDAGSSEPVTFSSSDCRTVVYTQSRIFVVLTTRFLYFASLFV